MSILATNPTDYMGGTWVEWGSGRVPVGVDASDSVFDIPEETGGSKTEPYTPAGSNSGGVVQNHTLTVTQIPSHNHSINRFTTTTVPYGISPGGDQSAYTLGSKAGIGAGIDIVAHDTNNTGGGGAHSHGFTQPTFTGTAATISHLQPYITCYMFKRTA